jgi:hypothetical protein
MPPTSPTGFAADVANGIRGALLRLARIEDDLAAREAASIPYWAPYPPTVLGHRAAAQALRDDADTLVA